MRFQHLYFFSCFLFFFCVSFTFLVRFVNRMLVMYFLLDLNTWFLFFSLSHSEFDARWKHCTGYCTLCWSSRLRTCRPTNATHVNPWTRRRLTGTRTVEMLSARTGVSCSTGSCRAAFARRRSSRVTAHRGAARQTHVSRINPCVPGAYDLWIGGSTDLRARSLRRLETDEWRFRSEARSHATRVLDHDALRVAN